VGTSVQADTIVIDSYTGVSPTYQGVNIASSSGPNSRHSAQTFRASTDYNITAVRVKLARLNTFSGTFIVTIKNAATYPTGGILCSGTIDSSEITPNTQTEIQNYTAGDWYEIDLGGGYPLVAGNKYAILVSATGSSTYGAFWIWDWANGYLLGAPCSAYGGTWQGTVGNRDFVFETLAIDNINTPIGNSISVEDASIGTTLIFDEVTAAGTTTVSESEIPPDTNPSGFYFLGRYFEVTTDATFSGITIILPYDPNEVVNLNKLKLFHYSNNKWRNVPNVIIDETEHTISGWVETLSVFAVAEQTWTADANGPYLGPTGTPITFSGTVSYDPNIDVPMFDWDWDDDTTSPDSGSSPSHTYTEAGIYNVCLTVTDEYGANSTSCASAIIYDPSGGFVTGGGWIESPAGAYTPDPSLAGKANFGFVSKYKKGATSPTGNTEFQFHAADLNFHSDNYDWLVVTGSDYARFKGTGTINGEGDYKFMLWAGDGEPDTFRIKIWLEDRGNEVVVYDNGMDQVIGGGNIIVHTKKK
jgi:hypothetical protein